MPWEKELGTGFSASAYKKPIPQQIPHELFHSQETLRTLLVTKSFAVPQNRWSDIPPMIATKDCSKEGQVPYFEHAGPPPHLVFLFHTYFILCNEIS